MSRGEYTTCWDQCPRTLLGERDLIIHTIKDEKGKYGRYLAKVFLVDEHASDLININEMMVKGGHAVKADY